MLSPMETLSPLRAPLRHTEASPVVRQVLRSDAMRVVLAVAELGSVRAAAEVVGLTPSAVSKQVRRIEEQLGRELFTRSRAGLAPNAEGEAIAGFARRFLSLAGEMGERFDRELVTGRVRLGMTDDVGLARMPELIRRCTAVHPGLRVELTVAYSFELLDMIAAHALDLAIVSDGGGALPPDARPLRSEPLIWAGRRGWRDPGGALPVAVSEQGCRWRARALGALERMGRPHDVRCTSKAMSGQVSAVRVGLGVAPVPASVVAGEPDVEVMAEGLPALPDCRLGLVGDAGASRALAGTAAEIGAVYG